MFENIKKLSCFAVSYKLKYLEFMYNKSKETFAGAEYLFNCIIESLQKYKVREHLYLLHRNMLCKLNYDKLFYCQVEYFMYGQTKNFEIFHFSLKILINKVTQKKSLVYLNINWNQIRKRCGFRVARWRGKSSETSTSPRKLVCRDMTNSSRSRPTCAFSYTLYLKWNRR